jgi:hypothetical protein
MGGGAAGARCPGGSRKRPAWSASGSGRPRLGGGSADAGCAVG